MFALQFFELSASTEWGPPPNLEHRKEADGNPSANLAPGQHLTVHFTFDVPWGTAGKSFTLHLMVFAGDEMRPPCLQEIRALPFQVKDNAVAQLLTFLTAPSVLIVAAIAAACFTAAGLLGRRWSLKVDEAQPPRVTGGKPRTAAEEHRRGRSRR